MTLRSNFPSFFNALPVLLLTFSDLQASPFLETIDTLKQHPFDVSLKMGVHLDPIPITLSIQLSNSPQAPHDGNLPFMGSFATTPEFLTTLFGDCIAHLTQFYLAKRAQIHREEATASSDSDDDSDKTRSTASPPPSPITGIGGAEDDLFL